MTFTVLNRLWKIQWWIVSCLFLMKTDLIQGLSVSESTRHVGFDLGTSGVRISVIERDESSSSTFGYREVFTKAIPWSDDSDQGYDDADAWMNGVQSLLQSASDGLGGSLDSVASICVSGTSASCLVVDRATQKVTRSARMYNYDVISTARENEDKYGIQAMELLEEHTPPRHTTRARTSSLAKLLTWIKESPLDDRECLCHQSDYISMKLMSSKSTTIIKSDWHNCLKLGYDVRNQEWPDWIVRCLESAGVESPLGNSDGGSSVIPIEVVSPGKRMGTISLKMSQKLGLNQDVVVVGGTTDSNAAFFAAAGTSPSIGTAVTSLGSTLAIKQLSSTYIEDADRGVYSHRFPTFSDDNEDRWLVGGASNVGCAVLRQLEFSNDELANLSADIDPMIDSPLSYYPLTKTGERFPFANSNKKPLLEPVPDSRKEFLHGILQSIADVERDGFGVLQELGAQLPNIVWTCGGGSKNEMWTRMRQRRLSAAFAEDDGMISVGCAECTEASFGAALLAAATF